MALIGALLLAGCVPQASATLDVPATIPNASLFGCAESALRDLHAADGHWNRRITLRDVAGGRLETGDFAKSNVMGFRIRLVRPEGASRASIHVRAAGPYFTDLGAQRALALLEPPLRACLERTPPTR